MTYETVGVRMEQSVCYLTLDRPQAGNCINATMVDECRRVLDACGEDVGIVVVQGSPDVFCLGADFRNYDTDHGQDVAEPEALYDLWLRLACGPFVSIAHVRGKANAGGVGFAAACDIVLADPSAEFSLSELLFSLFPACVLPFLIRRIGFQKAHYMTLTTKPVAVAQALDWGLVDACDANSDDLLRRHLLRLRHLSKAGIRCYKSYMNGLNGFLEESRPTAVAANREMFSDPEKLEAIRRFAATGRFPWEPDA